jgi:hypothetical protein
MKYVYIESEDTPLWTVGFFDPRGEWHPESDHAAEADAIARVKVLNGESTPPCKTRIKFTRDDPQYGDWKEGDVGYIDGYIALENVPYAVIVNERTGRITLDMFGGQFTVMD